MIPPAVEVQALEVHAGRRCLLQVDHVQADTGTITALMGPNGAGKTTLLRVCLGLATPSRGRVGVLGENVPGLRGAALAAFRRRLGYVPQLLAVRSELPLTVREVVAIGRTARAGLFRSLSPHDWQVVDHWLERVGLAPLADRVFSRLSGGEQRKTIIARAMAQEPELLLLDEPTANLDLGWRERIVETIQQLHEQTGISVLLVCHELEVLPPACRRVLLLEAGRVSAVGSPEAVFTTGRIRQLYGPNLTVFHHQGRHAVVPAGRDSAFNMPPSAFDSGGPHD
jgi:iron complex transport system ATP-binding protein